MTLPNTKRRIILPGFVLQLDEKLLKILILKHNLFSNLLFALLVMLCLGIGFYPLLYILSTEPIMLLQDKSIDLLQFLPWKIGFYTHITFGGISLLIGWAQFWEKFRTRYLNLHRIIGWTYTIAVMLSGIAGFYISFYASGYFLAGIGFGCLAIVWLTTTGLAIKSILEKKITAHQKWMLYSYAACLAAVSLRLQLNGLIQMTGEFDLAYTIVAWSCWVPNILITYFLVKRWKLA